MKIIKNAFRMLSCGLLATVCVQSQAQQYSYNTKFKLSLQNFVDTIPIEYKDHRIIINATCNGRTYRMMLDTGSGHGITYSNGSFPIGKRLGRITSHDANGKSSKTDVMEFAPFTIGHLTVRGYPGSIINSQITHEKYDAVLGFDLFNKGLSAKIDTRRGIMILTDIPGYFDKEWGHSLKYKLERWVPYIPISVCAGCTDNVLFDTGSMRIYVMSDASRKIFQHTSSFSSQIEGISYGSRAIGSFGAERPAEVAFLHLTNLQWGGFTISDYHTMTTQGHSRIGADLLQYGSVVINPKRKLLVFQPYGGNNYVSVGNSQTNIAFVPSGGRPMVGLIWEGSPHYKNGFRQGDIIMSVDGRQINSMQQFLSYPFITGRTYTFTVMCKNGETKTVVSER